MMKKENTTEATGKLFWTSVESMSVAKETWEATQRVKACEVNGAKMSDSISNVSSECTLRSSKNEQRNTGNDKQMGTIKLHRNERNNRRDRGEMPELGHNWKSQPKDCERIAGKTKTPTKKTFSASAQEKSQMSAKIADAKHMSFLRSQRKEAPMERGASHNSHNRLLDKSCDLL